MTTLFPLSRIVVVASTLLAVAVGLWPLASVPGVLASLAAIVVGTAAIARWRLSVASTIVLLFAYVHYGVARLLVGPELASMPFWLAAFAGLALGGGAWTRWESGGAWRLPLSWWATGVAVTWPFFAARDLGYSAAPSLAAGPIVTTAALQLSLALWMDRLLRSGADGEQRDIGPNHARWAWPLVASAMLTAAAALYQRFVDPAWLSGEPWMSMRRSVGMMGDANPTGVATALWAPLAWMLAAGGLAGSLAGGGMAAGLWAAAWASGA
ncbi:MAG: hypothetical protein OEW19_09310, partial [Acidobacteriota bacterium]|nr:hypothetical protein [Acidobacteriota bacterium]